MQTLNGIVWPEIAKLATEEVRRYGAGKKGYIIKLFIMQMAQDYCSPKRKIKLSYYLNDIFSKTSSRLGIRGFFIYTF